MQPHSFGTDLRAFELDGVRVAETLMPAGLHLDAHTHASGQLCYVLEGRYRERVGGQERVLSAGLLHVRAPGEAHENMFDEEALTLLISIAPRRWVDAPPSAPSRMLDDVAREIRAEMRRGDEAAHAALEGWSLLALSRVARRTVITTEPEWLGDAVAYIEHHCAEPLSLTSVATAFQVSRGIVAASFRRFRATSVGEHLRRARVARAKTLLRTNMALAAVALACGFHDQAHFTRVFRAHTGVTPGVYRATSSK